VGPDGQAFDIVSMNTPLVAILACLCAAPASGMQVTDDDGRVLELPGPAQRIVSLSPGATAMLFAAGAGERVIATPQFSDEPAAARAVPRIGDAQSFDIERILALRPDVVVAWAGGTPALALQRLERLRVRIYRHRVTRLDDLPAALRRLGRLAGTSNVSDPAAAALAGRIRTLRARYASAPHRSVLIQVWDRPIYTVGRAQLLSDVVEACGCRNVFDDLAAPGPAVSVEAVLARDPDVILALAPDVAMAQGWLDNWRTFPSLRAVREARLLIDTDPRLSRLGPETVSAAELLCRRLAMRAGTVTGITAPPQ
jgi:iron complex transport system substrate-binding protein